MIGRRRKPARPSQESVRIRAPRRRTRERGEALATTPRWLIVALVVSVVVTAVATFLQRPLPEVTEGAVTVEPIGSAVLLCPEPGAA